VNFVSSLDEAWNGQLGIFGLSLGVVEFACAFFLTCVSNLDLFMMLTEVFLPISEYYLGPAVTLTAKLIAIFSYTYLRPRIV
jgi:hypothetical protein